MAIPTSLALAHFLLGLAGILISYVLAVVDGKRGY